MQALLLVAGAEAVAGAGLLGARGAGEVPWFLLATAAATALLALALGRLLRGGGEPPAPPGGGPSSGDRPPEPGGPAAGDPWPAFEAAFRRWARERERASAGGRGG